MRILGALTRPDGRISALRVFLTSFILIVGMSGSWAVASPLMSVPDEPSHAVKAAAVVRGQLGGTPPKVQTGFVKVEIPAWMAQASGLTCYAFNETITPSCQKKPVSHSTELVTGATSAGAYNPVYYELVGFPSLFISGNVAVYAMRFTSAILSSLFLAGMFAALTVFPRRRWTATAAALSITPMVLYLNGSINPNSLEFAATGSFFVSLVALIGAGRLGRPNGWMLALATISAAILGNTRGLSLLWMAVALVLAIVICGWKNLVALLAHWISWIAVTVIAVACGFALWWLLTQKAPAGPLYDGARTPFWGAVGVMSDRTLEYAKGMIGLFGWGDTPAPDSIILVFGAAFLILLVSALTLSRGRGRAATLVALAALFALPVIIQASVAYQTGFIWQGRYSLALFVLLTVTAGFALDRQGIGWPAPVAAFARWTVILIAASHAYAFLWALRRYTTGIAQSRPWFDMFSIPTWNPPLGWGTWMVFVLVILAVASAIAWKAASATLVATLPVRSALHDGVTRTGGS